MFYIYIYSYRECRLGTENDCGRTYLELLYFLVSPSSLWHVWPRSPGNPSSGSTTIESRRGNGRRELVSRPLGPVRDLRWSPSTARFRLPCADSETNCGFQNHVFSRWALCDFVRCYCEKYEGWYNGKKKLRRRIREKTSWRRRVNVISDENWETTNFLKKNLSYPIFFFFFRSRLLAQATISRSRAREAILIVPNVVRDSQRRVEKKKRKHEDSASRKSDCRAREFGCDEIDR